VLLALHVERSRYWIPALPAVALAAASGLRALGAPEARRLVAGAAVATSLVVALHGYVPFLERTSAANLAAAGAYLDGIDEPRVEVLAIGAPGGEVNPAVAVPLLDLYTRKPLAVRDAVAPPPPAGLATSPLRFTWEVPPPPWYAAQPGGRDAAVAIVTDDLAAPLPDVVRARVAGLALARTFDLDEGVFGWRTLVAVYRPAAAPAPDGDHRASR
jgi:hypothetical protein